MGPMSAPTSPWVRGVESLQTRASEPLTEQRTVPESTVTLIESSDFASRAFSAA